MRRKCKNVSIYSFDALFRWKSIDAHVSFRLSIRRRFFYLPNESSSLTIVRIYFYILCWNTLRSASRLPKKKEKRNLVCDGGRTVFFFHSSLFIVVLASKATYRTIREKHSLGKEADEWSRTETNGGEKRKREKERNYCLEFYCVFCRRAIQINFYLRYMFISAQEYAVCMCSKRSLCPTIDWEFCALFRSLCRDWANGRRTQFSLCLFTTTRNTNERKNSEIQAQNKNRSCCPIECVGANKIENRKKSPENKIHSSTAAAAHRQRMETHILHLVEPTADFLNTTMRYLQLHVDLTSSLLLLPSLRVLHMERSFGRVVERSGDTNGHTIDTIIGR